MVKSERIVISGIGIISAAGNGVGETMDSFLSGKRNAGPVTLFPTELKCPVFEVKNIPREKKQNSNRTLSLFLQALKEATNDAGLTDELSNFRVGVCVGTTVASQLNDIDFYRAYRNTKNASMDPIERFLKGNLSEVIATRIKAQGPVMTVVNACSSGADAIGAALSWLRSGLCDIVIAGGADELNLIPFCGFASLGVASNSMCAPFDRDREGLNLGEGAGVLILETESHARKRGRDFDLFISGYGLASDAYHLTTPHPEGLGLEVALMRAMLEADITSEDVCFVNAHGTATIHNDQVEAKVLNKVFGPELTFLSTKGFTGHTLGAAGGLEAAFTALSLRKKWIPASIGFVNQDSEMPIKPVIKKTSIEGDTAISVSLAFGGNNTALVFGRA